MPFLEHARQCLGLHVDRESENRFMISPQFVISEGLGPHAYEIAFAGNVAQRWLADEVLTPLGIASDGSAFAAIHDARNVFWGAWGNAAVLAAEDRPDSEIAGYLKHVALLTEAETAWALGSLRSPSMGTYILGYFHGWRLLPFAARQPGPTGTRTSAAHRAAGTRRPGQLTSRRCVRVRRVAAPSPARGS